MRNYRFWIIGVALLAFSFFAGTAFQRFQQQMKMKSLVKTISNYQFTQQSAEARSKADKLSLQEKIDHFRYFTLPLNNPDIISSQEALHLHDDDLVTGVLLNGAARAYPWWIVANYHVINDTLSNVPILITLCEACGASSAFEARVAGHPAPLDFSSSLAGIGFGTFKIRDSETGSIWHPFSGLAFSGLLKGTTLKRIPVLVESWKEWVKNYPNSEVVYASQSMRKREHGMLGLKTPGTSELAVPPLLAKSANLKDERMAPHTLVFGVIYHLDPDSIGKPEAAGKAYKMEEISQRGLLTDLVESQKIIIIKTSGLGARAFKIPTNHIDSNYQLISRNPLIIQDDKGVQFNEEGHALKDSESLDLMPGYTTEWYEWVSAFPGTVIFQADPK